MNDLEGGAAPLLLKLGNEVRHTLHHIMGLLELAAEESHSNVWPRYLSQCRANAEQLLHVANDVSELAFEGEAPRRCSRFHLPEMVEEVAEVMQALAARKRLSFSWSIDPDVPEHVAGDRNMIQDMLRRVLDNAVKFTSSGCVTASVKTSKMEPDSVVIDFDISDTGPGIPANSGHTAEDRLRGLGLLIVRKRLIAMGGVLTCLSNPDGGSTVRLSAPLKPAADAPHSEDDARPARAASPLRLLVAEDSNESFALFRVYVKDEGHEVSRALDGQQAVEMVKAGEYDLVVMDIDMPVMDGYRATRAIREWETQHGRPRLPIILLSAEHAGRQRGMGASAGCSGYLTKPAPKGAVLQALHYYGSVNVA